jgi:hypothetical protein
MVWVGVMGEDAGARWFMWHTALQSGFLMALGTQWRQCTSPYSAAGPADRTVRQYTIQASRCGRRGEFLRKCAGASGDLVADGYTPAAVARC